VIGYFHAIVAWFKLAAGKNHLVLNAAVRTPELSKTDTVKRHGVVAPMVEFAIQYRANLVCSCFSD
jgi:hypothetical protein